jgi:hypothetical protein
MRNRIGLPRIVSSIAEGDVTWQPLEGLDYELLGYFLCCHLVIEHHMDEYLKLLYPTLDWDAAHHSFAQKVSLLSRFKVSDALDCIPAVKHLNSLRNKISHNVKFRIKRRDLLPLTRFLTKAHEGRLEVPDDPKGILDDFTSTTCLLFAGSIVTLAYIKGPHFREGVAEGSSAPHLVR